MRIFKQESGQTFIHFLTEYRLTAATYLLRETNESVSNIAARCGFDNFSYFIRIFKRKYGRTPSKLR
jgi:AraC-like DNA-binding protein